MVPWYPSRRPSNSSWGWRVSAGGGSCPVLPPGRQASPGTGHGSQAGGKGWPRPHASGCPGCPTVTTGVSPPLPVSWPGAESQSGVHGGSTRSLDTPWALLAPAAWRAGGRCGPRPGGLWGPGAQSGLGLWCGRGQGHGSPPSSSVCLRGGLGTSCMCPAQSYRRPLGVGPGGVTDLSPSPSRALRRWKLRGPWRGMGGAPRWE